MIKYLFLLIAISATLFSCKKENKNNNTASNNVGSGGGPIASLSLQSYPNSIGNQWVYKYYSKDEVTYNNTTSTYTTSYNYTITVTGDTTLPNNNKGKIWSLTFQNSNTTLRHIAYLDSTTNLFKVEGIESPSNPYNYITLNYPLTINKTWANIGQVPLDSCKVSGQESNNILIVDRGSFALNGVYKYKIDNKGLVYSSYNRIDITGNQITIIINENTLLSRNF